MLPNGLNEDDLRLLDNAISSATAYINKNLKTLAEKQMCICGEIVEVLPLAQSTVSQHLKELKNMGLIKGEIEGAKSCYCLDWSQMEHFFLIFQTQINELKQYQSDCKTC